MPKNIYCQKLKRNAEQLDAAPMPGELGQKIHQLISKPAWESWLTQQTMLINENHLTLTNPEAKAFLRENMNKFLFDDNYDAPSGFIPLK